MRTTNYHYLILLLIFGILTNTLRSQEENAEETWKIGIHLSPEMAYRFLTADKDDESMQSLIESRNEWERPALLFTGGLSVEYKLSDIFSLKSGIHYTLRGESSIDLGDGMYLEKCIYRNQYHYIGIPISASTYFMQNEKIKLFASVGAEMNFLYLISSRNTIKISGEEEKTEFKKELASESEWHDYTIFNPSLMLSIGCDLKIGQKSTFRIEPIFQGSLLPLMDAPISGYYFNVGLNLGYVFSL